MTRRFRSVRGSSPVAKFANDFVNALKGRRDRKTFGLCCSITWQTALQFAKTHGAFIKGFAHAYGPYEELCADRDVDVVYIATINLVHFDQITLALNHGNHVLEEKPMAMNVAQATATISRKNLFLMEGMWTRFFCHPPHAHHVHAAFGVQFDADNARMWHNELGGVLDIGIYPLAFATMVFGAKPEKITSARKLNNGGVDIFNSVTLEYSDSLLRYRRTVTISGSKGRIHLPTPAHTATEVRVVKYLEDGTQNGTKTLFPWPTPAAGAIQSKQTESQEYPLDESLQIMIVMDNIRKDMGLVYPADSK
ncbi:NAD(P)-binding domain [Phytophthora cactorum]|nr:NAD(P)-binding domain [Phytophthora cactorum]